MARRTARRFRRLPFATGVVALAGFGYPLAVPVGYSVPRRVRELVFAGIGLALLSRCGHAREELPKAG